MKCTECGNELELGVWDGGPAILPCTPCQEKYHKSWCDDCERRDCDGCEEYQRGVESQEEEIEEAFDRGVASRDVDVEAEYHRGYDEGYAARDENQEHA